MPRDFVLPLARDRLVDLGMMEILYECESEKIEARSRAHYCSKSRSVLRVTLSLTKLAMSSRVLEPKHSTGDSLELAGKSLNVRKPRISSGTSLASASILAVASRSLLVRTRGVEPDKLFVCTVGATYRLARTNTIACSIQTKTSLLVVDHQVVVSMADEGQ